MTKEELMNAIMGLPAETQVYKNESRTYTAVKKSLYILQAAG